MDKLINDFGAALEKIAALEKEIDRRDREKLAEENQIEEEPIKGKSIFGKGWMSCQLSLVGSNKLSDKERKELIQTKKSGEKRVLSTVLYDRSGKEIQFQGRARVSRHGSITATMVIRDLDVKLENIKIIREDE
jgi:hypothetical protein